MKLYFLFGLLIVGKSYAQIDTKITTDLDHDGVKDSAFYQPQTGILLVKLSTQQFNPIESKDFDYMGEPKGVKITKSGFKFYVFQAKTLNEWQFWYDKPTQKIRLIGFHYTESTAAGRETGDISANLLTDKFIAVWNKLEGEDMIPNKQVFKSTIHYPKIFLESFDQFSTDKFDKKLFQSLDKAKTAWGEKKNQLNQQSQAEEFPKNQYLEFMGTIAKQPVLVELTDTEDGLKGRYKYLKEGKIIPLDGVFDSQNGNKIELTEGERETNQQKPLWRGVFINGKITGTWYSADQKKKYTIQLEPQKRSEPGTTFKTISLDTTVLAHPKDTASVKFTFSYDALKARGTSAKARWMNQQLMKASSFDTNLSIRENIIKEQQKQVENYLKATATAEHLEYASWNWDWENAINVNFQKNGYLTLRSTGYDYSGGAHGNSWELYDNYDVKNQKPLSLNQIIRVDTTALSQLLESHLRKEYDFIKPQESLKKYLFKNEIKPNQNFYFDNWGLTFVYNQYEIAPYAMGIIYCFLPWEDLRPYFKEEFAQRMQLKLN